MWQDAQTFIWQTLWFAIVHDDDGLHGVYIADDYQIRCYLFVKTQTRLNWNFITKQHLANINLCVCVCVCGPKNIYKAFRKFHLCSLA